MRDPIDCKYNKIPSVTDYGMRLYFSDREYVKKALGLIGQLDQLLYECRPRARIYLRDYLAGTSDAEYIRVIDTRAVEPEIETQKNKPRKITAKVVDKWFTNNGYAFMKVEPERGCHP